MNDVMPGCRWYDLIGIQDNTAYQQSSLLTIVIG